jgi:hypothetical protein
LIKKRLHFAIWVIKERFESMNKKDILLRIEGKSRRRMFSLLSLSFFLLASHIIFTWPGSSDVGHEATTRSEK